MYCFYIFYFFSNGLNNMKNKNNKNIQSRFLGLRCTVEDENNIKQLQNITGLNNKSELIRQVIAVYLTFLKGD